MNKVGLGFAAMSMSVATAAMAQDASGASGGLTLRLICMGTGDHQVAHTSWGTLWTKHGSANAVGVSNSQDQFNDQMDVDLNGAVARARVPRRFLPAAHGGEGGWFDIKELAVSDDAITGTVLINFANHPKLRIDRRSGTIAMDGKVGAFAGQCKRVDPNEKAF